MPEVVEIVVEHRVGKHIDTLYRAEFDPTVVERPDVHHVVYDFIDDDDEQSLSLQSGSSDDEE